MSRKQLVMYSRSYPCPYVHIAAALLDEYDIDVEEILIDRDQEAMQRVLDWTGFLSVPTLVVAEEGSTIPIEPPEYLEHGSSPRGINRGSIITEPNRQQLKMWLQQHGFINEHSIGIE
ncbi:MAG: glutaredoxin family protein [Chloroflexi bacterium]|nr:glutaredoxin family protein [Chloroflexota bacterium]